MSKKLNKKEKTELIYLWLLKHIHEESSTTTAMKAWSLET